MIPYKKAKQAKAPFLLPKKNPYLGTFSKVPVKDSANVNKGLRAAQWMQHHPLFGHFLHAPTFSNPVSLKLVSKTTQTPRVTRVSNKGTQTPRSWPKEETVKLVQRSSKIESEPIQIEFVYVQ